MKSQTKGIKGILIIIGAVLIFIAPFIHIEFEKKNDVVEQFKKENKYELILPVKQKIKDNRLAYDNKLITAEEFIKINDDLTELLISNQLKYKSLVKSKIDEERVFGWKTLRVFLIGFGIRLPYLFFSLIISYLISIINTSNIFLKRAFTFLQISTYTISFYLLIWCFWYSQDYPLVTYRTLIVILCIIVSISVVYFIKHKQSIDTSIKQLIGLIGDIRVNHYFKIAKKGLDNDLTQREIIEDTDKLDDKIFDTLKSVAKNAR